MTPLTGFFYAFSGSEAGSLPVVSGKNTFAYALQPEDVVRDAAELLLDDLEFHLPNPPPVELSLVPVIATVSEPHLYRKQCISVATIAATDQKWILGKHSKAATSVSQLKDS
ncbi:uncharacterized protein BXZ73DRAFT_97808 [Epithele typhae]|uniref:uncharacterized protein n=1 Tax=Epithele typhae TaxID=378194 RepID=UPI00200842D7|nr:uncharacterized protein BXZ73DRAFT_97808 [Epithele typhae]KAH9942396.1 hypothetical protein BXZ73DRAFT_97808 [Epithele typhae]